MRTNILVALLCSLFLNGARAFLTNHHKPTKTSASSYLSAKPKFNPATQKWEASSSDDEEKAYGPFGSFLRQGPPPALVRLLDPESYDQAVLKYMATEDCSRLEAQGNMDAFFANAADWSYQKMEEKRGAPKVDYTKLKPKQAVLVLSWAFLITPLIGRMVYLGTVGGIGWGITVEDIFNF